MIWTSCYSNMLFLPKSIVAISISRFPPKNWKGPVILALAPFQEILLKYKEDHDEKWYVEAFSQQLALLDPQIAANSIHSKYGDKVALLCYEKPNQFCHRHLVAEWLSKAGIRCEEYPCNGL